jgi:Bacterial PH domain
MTQDAYAVFRPRRGRQFAWGFAGAQLAVFVVLAIVLPISGFGGWGVSDSVMLVVLGLLVAWALARFAALRATPSRSGLVVRNILVTTTVPWTDVVGVRFSGGDPWLYLDLASGDDLAVMAVQKSDGPFAREQAGRLAALVQAHRPAAHG